MAHPPDAAHPAASTRITLQTLERMAAAAEPFACLTCYDATTARYLAAGGVHVLLVGDTAAEVVLGLPRTIDMPLEVLLALTAGVKRGAPNVVVMGDMPFLSYQTDDATAIHNAGRFVRDGLADVVKLEADASFAPLVAKLVRTGIPVCGHVGSKPQHVALTGGYSSAGRTASQAREVIEDAVALARAGCRMLLIEAVPGQVTDAVLEALRAAGLGDIPVIGIGAGPRCHGQVLVLQDLVGMTDRPPRFAAPVASLGEQFRAAAAEWTRRVARREVGGKPYEMREGEAEKLVEIRKGTGASTDGNVLSGHLNGVHAGSKPAVAAGRGRADRGAAGKAAGRRGSAGGESRGGN